jgi:hypothetical protein
MEEQKVAPEGVEAAGIIGSESALPDLALTPQQQAEDILKRQNEFNVKLDALCKEYKFAITVVRKDLPNGLVFEPQLMDTKFMPKNMPVQVAGPGVEEKKEEVKAEEVKAEEVKPEEPVAEVAAVATE